MDAVLGCVFAIDTEQARRFWFLKYILDIFPVDPNNPMSIRTMVKAVRDGRRGGGGDGAEWAHG